MNRSKVSIRDDREADGFDTAQRAGTPAAAPGDPSGATADWKGESARAFEVSGHGPASGRDHPAANQRSFNQ